MAATPKPKLNKAQKENMKEAEAFRKKENASYKAHVKKRKEEKASGSLR